LQQGYRLASVDLPSKTLVLQTTHGATSYLPCDQAVLAMSCTPLVTSLLSTITEVPLQPIRYTRTWSVLVQVAESTRDLPMAAMWDTRLFADDSPMRILSFGIYPSMSNSVLFYVRVDDIPLDEAQAVWQFILHNYRRAAVLSTYTELTLIEMHPFPYTMPYGASQIDHINAAKQVPPSSFLHFAGQWLGFPSLETACYSGQRAAAHIMGQVTALDAQYAAQDLLYYRRYWLYRLGLGFGAILALVILVLIMVWVIRHYRTN
jgi:hypothetical protein